MALYTIADLHLSCAVEKPMDIFGGNWQGYTEKIQKNFETLLKPEDTVVLGGDISWGINLQEAQLDFAFLDRLPGRKIILKGNHDLWWNTMNKMQKFLEENHFTTIHFLHNNCYFYGKTAICGTRGWFYEEEFKEQNDEKIFKRELLRLEASFKAAKAQGSEEIYCFLHYPPVYANFRCREILDLMQQYGVSKCIYGHLHGKSHRYAFTGEEDGIQYMLVSGDYINFVPILLKK